MPGDFAVMSPPELGGGGGQMQDFGLSFEMCVHGRPLRRPKVGEALLMPILRRGDDSEEPLLLSPL